MKPIEYDCSVSGVIGSTVAILGDEVSEEDFIRCVYQNAYNV